MKKLFMNINSIDELMNVRETLEEEAEQLGKKIYYISVNPFYFGVDKKTTLNKLKDIFMELNRIDIIIKEGATFKTKEFAHFLTDVLITLGENKKLFKNRIITKETKRKTYYEDCYFIQNQDQNPNYIPCIFNYNDLRAFQNSSASNGIIILENETTYPLNSDYVLEDMYQDYPELESIFYQLIDLKIKEPKLSDNERFDRVLKNIKSYQKQKKESIN